MLGNRQLVSVFLIVVVLLGVFFSMGYLVGRNTSAGATADTGSSHKPIVIDNPTRAASGAATGVGESTPSPNGATSQPVEPVTAKPDTTKPDTGKPDRSSRAEPPATPPPLPEPKREPPSAEPAGKPSFEEPRPGQTFLQVVATTRADAEFVAETLAKKGFHTTVAAGPSPALFRVLVGPTKDASDLTETRVRVEAAGFKNTYVRKY